MPRATYSTTSFRFHRYIGSPISRRDSVANAFTPKSRMGKALVYTYTLLPRLGRYVLDGRYNIDNNGIENAIRTGSLDGY